MGFYDTWVARYALHPDHAFHCKAWSKLSRWTATLQLLHEKDPQLQSMLTDILLAE